MMKSSSLYYYWTLTFSEIANWRFKRHFALNSRKTVNAVHESFRDGSALYLSKNIKSQDHFFDTNSLILLSLQYFLWISHLIPKTIFIKQANRFDELLPFMKYFKPQRTLRRISFLKQLCVLCAILRVLCGSIYTTKRICFHNSK